LFSTRIGKALALTGSYIALAACPTALFAQEVAEDAAAEEGLIVVTGTAIRGTAPVGGSVAVVDQAAMRATGLASVNDVMKTVPQVMSLGAEEGRGGSAQSANSNITQAKTVNLRGLGTESTLVLLNGRRMVRNGSKAQFFDLSVIPTNAIGRMEVMADGASAIYGADAVGGVVNIITRTNDGIEAGVRYGFADGFDEKRLSLSGGLDRDWGNVFFAYEHYERSGLMGNERREVTMDLRPWGGPDLRTNFASPGTIVVDGVNYAVPTGTNGTGLTAADFVAGTANREDVNDYRSLLFDQNQDNFFGAAEFNLTDNLTAFLEGYYSSRKFDGLGSSLNQGGIQTTLTIPNTNAFFVHPTDPDATSVQMNYSWGDLIPPVQRGGEDGYNIAAGLSYVLPFDWTVDLYGSYGKNHANRYTAQPHVANLSRVLADSNPATAFNPYCDSKVFDCLNATAAELLNGWNEFNFYNQQWDFNLKASGSLAELPGGSLAVAVGGEIRREKLRSVLSYLTTTIDPTTRATESKRTAKSIYGEVVVPVFGRGNAIDGIVERLEFSAAVRHDNYGGFGGTTNPKFGFRYDPIHAISFRGSYGKSFRAPSLADVDIDATRGYVPVSILDPQTNNIIRAMQIQGARDGLGPERATTWTLGVDLRPAPGLRASFTYYDVDYRDRLTTVGASTVLGNPTVFADFLIRNPSEELINFYMSSPFYTGAQEPAANFVAVIDAQVSNLGGSKQRGIDGEIYYNFSALDSDWNLGATFNYILDAEESSAKGIPYRNVLDLIDYPVDFRGRAQLGWAKDGWQVTTFVNYVDSYKNTTVTPWQTVGSWTTVDLTVSYDTGEDAGFLKNTLFSVSMVNATDANPPLVINTAAGVQGAYDSSKASVIGRFVAFEVTKKF